MGIRFFSTCFFVSFVFSSHISLRSLESLFPLQITEEISIFRSQYFSYSKYLSDERLDSHLSNFGIEVDQFITGINTLEEILKESQGEIFCQNYEQEIAFLNNLTGTLIDRTKLIWLRRTLSHHGAVSNLNTNEQNNLLTLLSNIDERYQNLLSTSHSLGTVLKDKTTTMYFPISSYYFSSSFVPILNPNPPKDLSEPFFFSTLLASRQRQSKNPKREKEILTVILNSIYEDYQEYSWRNEKTYNCHFDRHSNVIIFIITWKKIKTTYFDANIRDNYSIPTLEYLLLFLKASIFGDVPHICQGNHNSKLIVESFHKFMKVFSIQVILHKERQKLYQISQKINSIFIESLQGFYKFLRKTFKLFRREKIFEKKSHQLYYTSLFGLFKQQLSSLKLNPPSPPTAISLEMKRFTDLSLEKAFLNQISFSGYFNAKVILESCFFELFVLYFDHSSGPINPSNNSFTTWFTRVDPLKQKFKNYLIKLFLPFLDFHTVLLNQLLIQLTWLYYEGRMLDSTNIKLYDQKFSVVASIKNPNSDVQTRLISALETELKTFLGDQHLSKVKYGACFLILNESLF
jgi:hypothetical protein